MEVNASSEEAENPSRRGLQSLEKKQTNKGCEGPLESSVGTQTCPCFWSWAATTGDSVKTVCRLLGHWRRNRRSVSSGPSDERFGVDYGEVDIRVTRGRSPSTSNEGKTSSCCSCPQQKHRIETSLFDCAKAVQQIPCGKCSHLSMANYYVVYVTHFHKRNWRSRFRFCSHRFGGQAPSHLKNAGPSVLGTRQELFFPGILC